MIIYVCLVSKNTEWILIYSVTLSTIPYILKTEIFKLCHHTFFVFVRTRKISILSNSRIFKIIWRTHVREYVYVCRHFTISIFTYFQYRVFSCDFQVFSFYKNNRPHIRFFHRVLLNKISNFSPSWTCVSRFIR